jgi:hypothetical protein
MQAELQTFLTTVAGAGLMDTVSVPEVLARWGYRTEEDWATYSAEDLIVKYGEQVPVWMLAAVLLNAGGEFTVEMPGGFGALADASHEFACGGMKDPLLDAAFSAANPRMAEYVRNKGGVKRHV